MSNLRVTERRGAQALVGERPGEQQQSEHDERGHAIDRRQRRADATIELSLG
jgi:hypothetical protein